MLNPELKILVVEDNPGDFFLLQELLGLAMTQPPQIVQAQSVIEAQRWLNEQSCDLILLDLSLPDSSGIDTFSLIFAAAPRTPIVVLSGLSDAEVALDTVKLGAQDYLVKGEFEEKLLYKVIAHSLERRRQLEQIEHSESKYRHLFESNPQPMLVAAIPSGVILGVNQAAVTNYGYSAREFLGLTMQDLIHPDEWVRLPADQEQFSAPYGDAGIWKHQTRAGKTLYVNILWHQMIFEEQRACLILAQDMTANALAEREKNLLIRELTHKNSHLEQFTYIVSHNLRAPVANLLGLCQLIQDENSNPALMTHAIKLIHESALRLDDVILNLNQTLSIQKGQTHQAYATVRLNKLIKDILEVYQPQLREADAKVSLELKIDEFSTIYSYLYSILENLVSNAIKYRSSERQLELSLSSSALGPELEIIVSDNGLGLPEASAYLFGMYKRFHSHVEGRGLGLFMCKNQAEALGGTITVQSVVGQGTVFRLLLPRAAGSRSVDEVSNTRETTGTTSESRDQAPA